MSSASATHTKAASFAAPFRHTAFKVIWTATAVSNVGGWMYSAASGWLMSLRWCRRQAHCRFVCWQYRPALLRISSTKLGVSFH
jgi:Transmembrane secretion effector